MSETRKGNKMQKSRFVIDWDRPESEQIEIAYKSCLYSLAFGSPLGFSNFRSIKMFESARNREYYAGQRNTRMYKRYN